MAPEVTVEHTYVGFHPCYEIHNVSYRRTSTPSTVCVLLYVFLGSLSVVTICGNLLVIISIIYFKQLHTPTNSLILSLAVADLLVGLVVFPFNMEFSISSCVFSENVFCKVRESFDVTLCTASIFNLCCISIDRYYAVCHPLTYRTKINVHVVVIMIVVSWSVSLLVAIGPEVAGLNHERCEQNCIIDVLLAYILGTNFSFYLPVILMLCIYLKIFLVAQRQVRSIQGTKSGATASKMERKSTKTLATVMGVFLMCWTPFFICTSTSPYVNFTSPGHVTVIQSITSYRAKFVSAAADLLSELRGEPVSSCVQLLDREDEGMSVHLDLNDTLDGLLERRLETDDAGSEPLVSSPAVGEGAEEAAQATDPASEAIQAADIMTGEQRDSKGRAARDNGTPRRGRDSTSSRCASFT
ncbi:trace amine-associated receptor 1-like [Chelmon rostratus]|uniref:trace amine-associated receptor 1-like n=1 Tax=Chelmon rostratus TaxID=109905 RepID=UPI001BEC5E53|nr:trace amine-associated receptor 1-like [Chelmon rostratus]